MVKGYLGGKISGLSHSEATLWRDVAHALMPQIEWFDPMRGKTAENWDPCTSNYPGLTAQVIFERDIADIDECDFILINYVSGNSHGTSFEMGYAFANAVPIYVIVHDDFKDHPFICVPSTRIFKDLNEAAKWINDHFPI